MLLNTTGMCARVNLRRQIQFSYNPIMSFHRKKGLKALNVVSKGTQILISILNSVLFLPHHNVLQPQSSCESYVKRRQLPQPQLNLRTECTDLPGDKLLSNLVEQQSQHNRRVVLLWWPWNLSQGNTSLLTLV